MSQLELIYATLTLATLINALLLAATKKSAAKAREERKRTAKVFADIASEYDKLDSFIAQVQDWYLRVSHK